MKWLDKSTKKLEVPLSRKILGSIFLDRTSPPQGAWSNSLVPAPSTLNPQPSTLNTQHTTHNPEP